MKKFLISFRNYLVRLPKRDKTFLSLGVVLILWVSLGSLPASDGAKSKSSISTNSKTENAVFQTPEEELTELINTTAGNDSNIEGIDMRVRSLELTADEASIELYGDENLTEGLIKSSNRRLVLKTIDAYQASGIKAEQVNISVWFPLVDEAGVPTLRQVLSYGFSSSQIARIQTSNIDTERMDNGMADVYTSIYPAFRW